MWVQSLGREDSLEKGMATHASILASRSLAKYSPWGCKESDTSGATEHTHSLLPLQPRTAQTSLGFPSWKCLILPHSLVTCQTEISTFIFLLPIKISKGRESIQSLSIQQIFYIFINDNAHHQNYQNSGHKAFNFILNDWVEEEKH